VNIYPNAYYTASTDGAEPSIRAHDLCIPITAWFSGDSKCAFPLIALQYNELTITVTLRPIQELFRVRDVFDEPNDFPYIQPDFNNSRFLMYRFLQSPPAILQNDYDFSNKVMTWNADPHLISTYCFLSAEEAQTFAAEDQIYLVKDVIEYSFSNISGATRVRIPSSGLVASWMFHLRRSDANLRNEWSNYTNWPYANLPVDVTFSDKTSPFILSLGEVGPFFQPAGNNTGIFVTGEYSANNEKHILLTMGILLDGEYRENTMNRIVYDHIEKYARTRSFAPEGQYCYNFCINSAMAEYQPSGAINLSKFRTIELEIEVVAPTPSNSATRTISSCSDGTDTLQFSDMAIWSIYEYTFDLVVYEERYNVLSFIGGSCGMLYAR
jgi:hypothetical protein